MNRDQLMEIVERALVNSPRCFEEVSNVSSWRMPESWIAAQIMHAVHEHRLFGVPEVSISRDLEEFESGGRTLMASDVSDLAGAKIDLFIGESGAKGGKIRVRIIVELKGSQSTWKAFGRDIDRLQKLCGLLGDGDQAALLAYVTAPLTKNEQEKDFHDFIGATGLNRDQVKVICGHPVSNDERRTYVYTHTIFR